MPLPTIRYSVLLTTCLSLSMAAPAVLADEPGDNIEAVLVTGSRTPIPANQLGTASTVLSAEDIARRQNPIVSDLLRGVPGLAVSRSGGVGGLTQLRIRGAEGNHTLVLVDGIEANELNFNGEFDFSFLNAAGIERIEVLRGAQSALYGSDAIGGVVNIITTQGTPGFRANLMGEGGAFGTRQFGGSVSGGSERFTGAANVNYFEDDGHNISRTGDEKDGFRNISAGLKARARPTDTLTFDGVLRYADSRTQSDAAQFNFPSMPTDGIVMDSDNEEEASQLYGRFQGSLALLDGLWSHRAGISYADTEREFFAGGAPTARSGGERLKFDYQTTLSMDAPELAGSAHSVTFAFEREEMDFLNEGATPTAFQNQKQSDSQNSFIGEYRVGFADQVFLSASLRHDDNDLFDNATTYRITGAWLVEDWGSRLHASFGTGITNPGFFELFGFIPAFFIGNPDLEPEESKSFDVGFEQKFLGGDLTIDVTYFHADLTKEIITTFDFVTFLSGVENLVGKSKRDGVEITLDANISEAFSLSASYAYVRSRQPDGMPEVRRPKHTASLNANYGFAAGRGNLNLDVAYNGKQQDFEFVPVTPEFRVTLDSYVLVTLAGSYRISDRVEIFARAENLLDEKYEEVFSYRSRGIGAFAGVRVNFGS